MSDVPRKRKARLPWVVVGILLAAYPTSYLCLGERHDSSAWIARNYPTPFIARLFIPLGVIKTIIGGRPVSVMSIQKDSDFMWDSGEHWPLLDHPPAVKDFK